ncbi:MAG: hypothetical protein QM651_10555 [Rhodoblastus sp.]
MSASTPVLSRRSALAAISGAAVSMLAAPASACGYDNPDDLAQYLINIRYPKAMYVRAAVAEAEAAGLLPPGASQKPGADPFAFLRAAARLKALGDRLAPPQTPGASAPISLVLLESALWTRYTPASGVYATQVHAPGPAPGDAVVVTETAVVTALLGRSLTFAAASTAELVRLYGPDKGQAALRAAFARFA